MFGYFEEVDFAPGTTLWKAGQPADFCVGVVTGELHAYTPPGQTSDGEALRLSELVQPGVFVGFAGTLNQLTYVATVVVPPTEWCTCLVLRWSAFRTLETERPRLATAVLRYFLRRMAYEWRYYSRLAAQG